MERRCALPQTWVARERERFGPNLCTIAGTPFTQPVFSANKRCEKYTHNRAPTRNPTTTDPTVLCAPHSIIATNPLATSTTPTGPNTPNTPKSVQIRLPLKRRCISRSFRSSNSSCEEVSSSGALGSAERRMRRGLRR